jgi:hypothetical protein
MVTAGASTPGGHQSVAQQRQPSVQGVTAGTAASAGPAWVKLEHAPSSRMTFSANGKWYAFIAENAVIVGDSTSFRPLALVPLNIDKAGGITFHPHSTHLVATLDFTVMVWQVREQGDRLELLAEAPLPTQESPDDPPPAFDADGRLLAVNGQSVATIYDFTRREPIHLVSTAGMTTPSAMVFLGQALRLVQATLSPCMCDSFGGSDAWILTYAIGAPHSRALRVAGDLPAPLSLRGSRISAPRGVWDAATGRRLGVQRLNEEHVLMDIARLRKVPAAVGLVAEEGPEKQALFLLRDDGRSQRLAELGSALVLSLAVRPQDDRAVLLDGTSELTVVEVPLDGGAPRRVRLPARLCVDDSAVVPDERCAGINRFLDAALLPNSPAVAEEFEPVTLLGEPPVRARSPREGEWFTK